MQIFSILAWKASGKLVIGSLHYGDVGNWEGEIEGLSLHVLCIGYEPNILPQIADTWGLEQIKYLSPHWLLSELGQFVFYVKAFLTHNCSLLV